MAAEDLLKEDIYYIINCVISKIKCPLASALYIDLLLDECTDFYKETIINDYKDVLKLTQKTTFILNAIAHQFQTDGSLLIEIEWEHVENAIVNTMGVDVGYKDVLIVGSEIHAKSLNSKTSYTSKYELNRVYEKDVGATK